LHVVVVAPTPFLCLFPPLLVILLLVFLLHLFGEGAGEIVIPGWRGLLESGRQLSFGDTPGASAATKTLQAVKDGVIRLELEAQLGLFARTAGWLQVLFFHCSPCL